MVDGKGVPYGLRYAQNMTLPHTPRPGRLSNPQSRNPRAAVPSLGNAPQFLLDDQSRLPELADIPQEAASRPSIRDLCWL
jgi:hypothetical protein